MNAKSYRSSNRYFLVWTGIASCKKYRLTHFGSDARIAESIYVLACSMLHTYKHTAELTFAKKPLKNFLSWNGGLVQGYGMGGKRRRGLQMNSDTTSCECVWGWSLVSGVLMVKSDGGQGLGGIRVLAHQSDIRLTTCALCCCVIVMLMF